MRAGFMAVRRALSALKEGPISLRSNINDETIYYSAGRDSGQAAESFKWYDAHASG
jgi:hypothetical protein